MPRELDPDLQALIDSGHVESHTAVKITLGDETELLLATGQFQVGEDLYLPELDETSPLKMSLTQAVDRSGLKVQNVDSVFGQQLTSTSDALDGATAVLGIGFRAQDGSGPWYFDEKMPGDLIAGEVTESTVALSFVGDIYGAQVVGETVASVFPYQQETSAHVAPPSDPNDLANPNGFVGGGGLDLLDLRGRLPMTQFDVS